uniref:Uncharacterized protein n=1 Tax=Caenorhabditis japonica TaxID=281687 RepID=A0A8R1IRW3_CAEJA
MRENFLISSSFFQAPAFIPKHQQKPPPPPPQQSPLTNQFAQMAIHDVPQQIIPYSQAHSLSFGGPLPHHRPHPHHSPQIHHPPPQAPFNQYQLESRGGTTYFYPEDHQQPPHDKNQFEEQAMPDGVIPVVKCTKILKKKRRSTASYGPMYIL